MATKGKQIPRPDELDLELYQHIVRSGQPYVQRCTRCHTPSHPPRRYCPSCFSPDYEFVPVSGGGTVYSFTVSHYSVEPAWQDELPYVTVVVELDEGPRLVGAGRGFEIGNIQIGSRVRVVPESKTDDFAFLWVEPA